MLPLLSTLAIAASLLLLEKMLNLFDFVAAEGGPVSVVWRMLANLLPEYLSLGIPIGLLLGILLAFRRLATSSELDIFRAVGMSYFRLLRVPFLFAITLAAVNFAIVGFLQPTARYYYEELRFELRSGAFGAKVRVGEFNNVGENLTVRIEESRDNGNQLSGMFVYAESKSGQSLAVTAEEGQFLRTDDPDTILLRLEKGTLVHDAPNFETPRDTDGLPRLRMLMPGLFENPPPSCEISVLPLALRSWRTAMPYLPSAGTGTQKFMLPALARLSTRCSQRPLASQALPVAG